MNDYINTQKLINRKLQEQPHLKQDADARSMALFGVPLAIGAMNSRGQVPSSVLPSSLVMGTTAGFSSAAIERLIHRKRIAKELGIDVNLLGKPLTNLDVQKVNKLINE
jgi:hypothetical protein